MLSQDQEIIMKILLSAASKKTQSQSYSRSAVMAAGRS